MSTSYLIFKRIFLMCLSIMVTFKNSIYYTQSQLKCCVASLSNSSFTVPSIRSHQSQHFRYPPHRKLLNGKLRLRPVGGHRNSNSGAQGAIAKRQPASHSSAVAPRSRWSRSCVPSSILITGDRLRSTLCRTHTGTPNTRWCCRRG